MKTNLAERVRTFDDIFSSTSDGKIIDLPIVELHDFKSHPFRVQNNEKMKELVDSVRKFGVLEPGIARPRAGGGYEVLAGHRRKMASILAGRNTMPFLVKNYSDDEATIIMVDSNMQREEILPSEKGFAYRMKYEALRHQGKAGGNTFEEMGEQIGESGRTVQRYIRLTYLDKELLQKVDESALSFGAAVELSYLPIKIQSEAAAVFRELGRYPTSEQGQAIRQISVEENPAAKIISILQPYKPVKRKYAMSQKEIDRYFPATMTNEEINTVVEKLIEEWSKEHGYLSTE